MDSEKQGVYLALKRARNEGITLLCRRDKVRTPSMEFVLGEIDNDQEYQQGEEVSYIYNADYTDSLNSF